MADTTTRNDELEVLLRRAIEVANEIRPGFVMENLLRQALAAAGVDEWAPPKFDPDPRPAGADAPGPPVVTTLSTPGGEHRNLKPEAAKRQAAEAEQAVREARKLRRVELGADEDGNLPAAITMDDLEDEAPERETPTTDPNGANHGEDPDVNRMGRFTDNGAGMTERDDLKPTDTTTDQTTSDQGTVSTASTPGPAAAREETK